MKQVKLVWWFVWGALTMSALMYLVLLQTGESEADPDYSDSGLRSILMMVSLVSVMISFAVHFFITKRMVAKREGVAVMKALTPFIVSLALAESVAIYGLLLGMQGEDFTNYIPFFVISFFTLLLIAPVYLLRK
ncbi:MAG: hypothetical protein QM496_10370 [Verrucomicrobiota bacterium]